MARWVEVASPLSRDRLQGEYYYNEILPFFLILPCFFGHKGYIKQGNKESFLLFFTYISLFSSLFPLFPSLFSFYFSQPPSLIKNCPFFFSFFLLTEVKKGGGAEYIFLNPQDIQIDYEQYLFYGKNFKDVTKTIGLHIKRPLQDFICLKDIQIYREIQR